MAAAAAVHALLAGGLLILSCFLVSIALTGGHHSALCDAAHVESRAGAAECTSMQPHAPSEVASSFSPSMLLLRVACCCPRVGGMQRGKRASVRWRRRRRRRGRAIQTDMAGATLERGHLRIMQTCKPQHTPQSSLCWESSSFRS